MDLHSVSLKGIGLTFGEFEEVLDLHLGSIRAIGLTFVEYKTYQTNLHGRYWTYFR